MPLPRAVIVSHGQPSDPEVGEREICALARQVAAHLPGRDVRGATLAAPLAVWAALRGAPAGTPVYPMFMADGWFTSVALPRRLGAAQVVRCAPFGLDPALPELAARWLATEIAEAGWDAAQVRLMIAGHGSGRSPRPARVTRAFAQALGARLPLAGITCGFVEEPPHLQHAATGLGARAICLPFFATRRGHVLEDLPQALDAAGFTGLRLPPLGLHPDIPALIARSLSAPTAADQDATCRA